MPRVSHNILKDILSGMRTAYLSFPFVQTVCPGSCLLPILLGRNIGKNCLPAVTITAATASPIYPPRNLPRFSYHFLSQFFKFSRLVAGLVAGMAVSTKTLAIYCRPIFTFGRESFSLRRRALKIFFGTKCKKRCKKSQWMFSKKNEGLWSAKLFRQPLFTKPPTVCAWFLISLRVSAIQKNG